MSNLNLAEWTFFAFATIIFFSVSFDFFCDFAIVTSFASFSWTAFVCARYFFIPFLSGSSGLWKEKEKSENENWRKDKNKKKINKRNRKLKHSRFKNKQIFFRTLKNGNVKNLLLLFTSWSEKDNSIKKINSHMLSFFAMFFFCIWFVSICQSWFFVLSFIFFYEDF